MLQQAGPERRVRVGDDVLERRELVAVCGVGADDDVHLAVWVEDEDGDHAGSHVERLQFKGQGHEGEGEGRVSE